jgi:hypothetical protein
MAETRKNQFSLRAILALTAASATWFWLFREASPIELTIFSIAALAAGLVGHTVYIYWLPSRFTVVVAVFLLYNFTLVILEVIGSGASFRPSDCLQLLIDIVVEPAEWAIRAWGTQHMLFSFAFVIGTLLFTPAHMVRPGLPGALITALGLGIWYGAGILLLTHASA